MPRIGRVVAFTFTLLLTVLASSPQPALADQQKYSGLVYCWSHFSVDKYLSNNIYTEKQVFNCSEPVEIQIYLTVYVDWTGSFQVYKYHWPYCTVCTEERAWLDMQNLVGGTYKIEAKAWFRPAYGVKANFPTQTTYITISGGPSSPAP